MSKLAKRPNLPITRRAGQQQRTADGEIPGEGIPQGSVGRPDLNPYVSSMHTITYENDADY
jgi:hypothetical protein